MQNSVNELKRYIVEHNMVPITTGYNVTVQEPISQLDSDNLVVDIYVGVVKKPNIL